jgi:hypothetical protein
VRWFCLFNINKLIITIIFRWRLWDSDLFYLSSQEWSQIAGMGFGWGFMMWNSVITITTKPSLLGCPQWCSSSFTDVFCVILAIIKGYLWRSLWYWTSYLPIMTLHASFTATTVWECYRLWTFRPIVTPPIFEPLRNWSFFSMPLVLSRDYRDCLWVRRTLS